MVVLTPDSTLTRTTPLLSLFLLNVTKGEKYPSVDKIVDISLRILRNTPGVKLCASAEEESSGTCCLINPNQAPFAVPS